MKLAWLSGIALAVLLHAAFLLFGGLLFPEARPDAGTLQQVELLQDPSTDEQPEPEEQPAPDEERIEAEQEAPPDSAEITRTLEASPLSDAPALDAATLGAIEQALNGQGGGGDFGDALSFSSGGRIGGTGKAGALDQQLESAFSLSEIDQKPRVVLQASPVFPSEMRGRKVEGAVTVIFVVEASGKVSNPRVEKSTHPAFDRPALDAVRQWRFEPAIKAGQRVACKMRIPIRFPSS